jgi:hypothetical protein
MMKKVALYGSLLALVGATAAYAQGQFPGYPLATSSPSSGNASTLPLTGVEQIPADTMLGQGIQPQTEVIQTQQLKAYVLTAPSVTGGLSVAGGLTVSSGGAAVTGNSTVTGTLTVTGVAKIGSSTIAALPTCNAGALGTLAVITNGTAYATGVYGDAVGATGAVTRLVLCSGSGGWVYN